MTGRFDDLVDDIFKLEADANENKVMSLREAVQRFIKPRTSIHIGATHCCSNAAIIELARQFNGKQPDFTLIARGVRDTTLVLLHLGLVKKVITAFSGDVYPRLGPNQIAQKAYANKQVELENWSLLTFTSMLMAGALGLPFMPTMSLLGSSMATDNNKSFKATADPFGSGREVGLLKALNPDVSIVHGLVADRQGNTILTPPYSENVWGAKASTGGAIVTVERLVSTDFIRKHSHLVKLPGYLVNSVSVVPFGAHPCGVWNQGVESMNTYAEDYAFMTEFNQLCSDPEALERWVKEWVLECGSFDDYLAKLGHERLLSLKDNAHRDAWKRQLNTLEDMISESQDYNPTEMMLIMASREIRECILKNKYKTMLAGAGTANLAAWVAKYQLQSEDYEAELMVEMGSYGNAPRPCEPYVLNFGNFATCKMLTESLDTLGVFTGGATNRCIGVLGGGQVDKYGNINSTWMSEDFYLSGSGGVNDVATGAGESIIVMQQSRRRFLEQVPYITAPGGKVKTLVSNMGVFQKLNNDKEFTLTKYYPDPTCSSRDEIVKKIKDNCSWDLRVIQDPQQLPPPSLYELRLLRIFDPKKYYI